jgi:hypothetical protein
MRLIPCRPAVSGLPGYQNGIRSCSGFVDIGIVGKSKKRLLSLEISPERSARSTIPSTSVNRSRDSHQSWLNQ